MKNRQLGTSSGSRGFSLLEILVVVTIMGILAAVVIPRMGPSGQKAKGNSCHVNTGNVEIQSQLWFRNKNSWPAADLSDIGADTSYFPDGLPTCPVDGSSYAFDSSSQSVTGHTH